MSSREQLDADLEAIDLVKEEIRQVVGSFDNYVASLLFDFVARERREAYSKGLQDGAADELERLKEHFRDTNDDYKAVWLKDILRHRIAELEKEAK